MPHHPHPTPGRVVAAALLVVALGGCAAGASTPPPAPEPSGVDPAARADGPRTGVEEVAPAHEIVLSPDPDALGLARDEVLEIRHVFVGDRREVTMGIPGHVLDRHVVTADQHWWWLHPEAREATGVEVEWVHIDIEEVASVGGRLPDLVAEARTPLPSPAEVEVGDVLSGREILAVRPQGRHAVRLTVADLPVDLILRRRDLPASTAVEPPVHASELRDLAEQFGR